MGSPSPILAESEDGGTAVFVYGAGGHGRVVADALQCMGLRLGGFVDDDPTRQGHEIWDFPILSFKGFLSGIRVDRNVALALGIGNNEARERIYRIAARRGIQIISIAHPSSTIAISAQIGSGTVILSAASVNPDARVGAGTILNTGCVVEHDVVIGNFSHVCPNAAFGGEAMLGAHSQVGIGAAILPRVSIGTNVRVGAGAVVTRDVPDGVTVVGVPARPLPSREGELVRVRDSSGLAEKGVDREAFSSVRTPPR
jgi:sugar O-acyltransferase (sialic acid O-acetyltransferase NeuD family)